MKPDASFFLKVTLFANVAVFFFQEHYYPYLQNHGDAFSVHNRSVVSMIYSMFVHNDLHHLASNMIGLWIYGREVFVKTSSPLWKSPAVFLCVFFGAGLMGFYGTILVASLHDLEFARKMEIFRRAHRCSHWLCQEFELNSLFRPLVDAWGQFEHANMSIGRLWYKNAPRIGASSAVYGVMAARLYTSVAVSGDVIHHAKMHPHEIGFLVLRLATEVVAAPWRLENLSLFDNDNVDHVGHISGFVGGLAVAWGVQRLSLGRRQRPATDGLTSFSMYYATVLAIIGFHIFRKNLVTDAGTTVASILFSLFSHSETDQLCINLLVLLFMGSELFVFTSSKTWKNSFLFIYVGSGVLTYAGLFTIRSLSNFYLNQSAVRTGIGLCSWRICDDLGLNFVWHVINSVMKHCKKVGRAVDWWWLNFASGQVGANGAVFGVVGARLNTALFSHWHRKIKFVEVLVIVVWLGNENYFHGLNIDSKIFSDEVRFGAQCLGIVGGFFLSFMMQVIFLQHNYNWGRGQRLGSAYSNRL